MNVWMSPFRISSLSFLSRMGRFSNQLRWRHAALARRYDANPFSQERHRAYLLLREELAAGCERHRNVPACLDAKQRREFAIFVQFLLAHRRFSVDSVSIGDAPEFILTVHGRRLGLELTEAFVPDDVSVPTQKQRGSIRLEQESIQDRIVEEGQTVHAAEGGKPMRVSVMFRQTDFRKRDIRKHARELASFVPKLPPAEGCISVIERAAEVDQTVRIPEWLLDVRISARPVFLQNVPRWAVSHGGSVYSATGAFARSIAEKEEKLLKYRELGCDEYWLLITVRGDTAASFLTLRDAKQIFHSSFQKVFAFWPLEQDGKQVIRLNNVTASGRVSLREHSERGGGDSMNSW